MGLEIRGLKELKKKMKDMERKINKVIEKEWTFSELFTPEFMSKHTKYASIEDFLKNSPANIVTQEEFDKRDKEKFDAFIKENTDFNNWEEFKQAAGYQLAKKELEKKGLKLE